MDEQFNYVLNSPKLVALVNINVRMLQQFCHYLLILTTNRLKCKASYSCPCLVVQYTEELISRTFLGEIQFQLVSQDRISAQNAIGYLVFVSRSLFV